MGNHDKFIDAVRRGKFHGHTRLITEDVVTKKREIVEDDNMFTSALDRIFETNALGSMTFYELMPLTQLIGGVFLFDDVLTESADNIYPPSQASNKLTGFAGQTAHSSSNPYRGNPNGVATEFDRENGRVKFVWDWLLEQAIGRISSCALTSAEAGDVGLYPDGTLPLLKTCGIVTSGSTSFTAREAGGSGWSEEKANRCPLDINSNGLGISVFLSGNTLKENTVRHPFVRPSLIEGYSVIDNDNFTVVSSRSAQLSRSYTDGYSAIAHDDDYYYIMECDSGSATTLYLDIVSRSDMSVTSKTITISGATLARTNLTVGGVYNGIVSGGNIYWISGDDAKTFVRINIQTPADTAVLTSYMTEDIDYHLMPITKTAGLVLGENFLINGDFVYPVAIGSVRSSDTQPGIAPFYKTTGMYKNSPMVYQMGSYNGDVTNRRLSAGPSLYLPYLATVNNLQTVVQKTANKTLRCEYIITLAGGN